ncbi:Rrf2 family transcriptional regulator [Shimazuella sp. AN120528]|uniref:RrF2 family transcriptional regulator n=1 Tax=Shimazuella soli TaxID=1892854 RepID=UPI001F107A0D|nr:Rrf2 family transcriptional regulator [Shimazuella soli]MCH5585760.1 Rrf2 family transcriptional regulator [Shimazuella soli]
MQFSVGVEYALHCLVYLVNLPPDSPIGIKDLAAYQGVSDSYLSKFFTQLVKAGIVRSVPGVKGGYELAKKPEDISFWNVVTAIQGEASLFQCKEIRHNTLPFRENKFQCYSEKCLINSVMLEAESHLKNYLCTKTIAWLHENLDKHIPEIQQEQKRWFKEKLYNR